MTLKLRIFLLGWLLIIFSQIILLAGSRTVYNLDSLQHLCETEVNPQKKVKRLFEIGKHYKNHSHTRKLTLAEQILKISDSVNYEKGRIMGLMLKAEAYLYASQEYKSISHFAEALQKAEKIKDDTLISECLYNFFYLHYENDQIEIAKAILNRKIKIDSAFHTPKYHSQNHDFLGLLCEREGLYDSARYHYKQAFNYALLDKDSASASTYLSNIAIVYALEGNYKSAIDLHKYVIKIKQKIDDNFTIGYVRGQIAKNYLMLNQLDSAYKYANDALLLHNDIYITVKSIAYEVLYKVYKQRKQFDKALRYLELYQVEYDSLNNQAKTNALANIQYNFEIDKKAKEMELKVLELKNKDLIVYTSIIGLVAISIFSVVLLINVRENQKLNSTLIKQKAELYEKNQEIESQNEEIIAINQHQEEVIDQRTKDLRESEALLKMSQKLAKLGSWVLNIQNQTMKLKCSDEFVHIFEHNPNEAFALENFLSYMHVHDAATFKLHLENTYTYKVPFETELPISTANGQKKWLHFIGIPVVSPTQEDEKVIEIMGCAQDITERKQAEQLVMEQAEEIIHSHKKAAEYKLMALRSVMNPHFLFNSLNSIQYFIAKNIKEQALDYLSQFSKLMRLVLNSSIQNKIALADEIETLKLYCNLESIRFENFDTVFEVDEDIDIHHTFVPSLLLQPYVENAILHGLSKRTDNLGLLKISFFLNENEDLVCVIDDNGIGRQEAQKLKAKDQKLYKSVGMLVTSERLELINQNEQVGVQIIDKVNADGTALGTTVEVTIKLERQITNAMA